MKKFIWIAALTSTVAYGINELVDRNARRETELNEAVQIDKELKASVLKMAMRAGAITDWEAQLSKGETVRMTRILTVELERVWLRKSPVLFVGAIMDIATKNQDQYIVSINKGLLGNTEYTFGTNLRLSLAANKRVMDAFLAEHPEVLNDFGMSNGVAVIARIGAIKADHVFGENADSEEVRIGEGEMMDILYIGDAIL